MTQTQETTAARAGRRPGLPLLMPMATDEWLDYEAELADRARHPAQISTGQPALLDGQNAEASR